MYKTDVLVKENSMDKIIGLQARYFRVSRGMTQPEFARETGLSETMISRFERGLSKNMYVLFQYMRLGYEPPVEIFGNYKD